MKKIAKTEIEFDINEIVIKILGNKYVDWDDNLIKDVYKLVKTYPPLKK